MNALSLLKKFTALFNYQDAHHIDAARVNEAYKRIAGNSKASQKKLINDLSLDHVIFYRKGSHAGKIVLDSNGSPISINHDLFRSGSMVVYINMDQFAAKLTQHQVLSKIIEELPDINSNPPVVAMDTTSVDSPQQTTASEAYPIIELEEHELFRDANGNAVKVDVRGERAPDKIRFKAKDIAVFFGMDNLIKIMLRNERSEYQLGCDFVIIGENVGFHHGTQGAITKSDQSKVNHDHVFLTLKGLLRVVCVSRSGNANILAIFDQIQRMVYVSQFGSVQERQELSADILKIVLNEKLSCLYLIDLGSFQDLYDSMAISRDNYPPDTYGHYRIGKFGFAHDASERLKQHKSKTGDGYGQWCKRVELKWIILLSPSQLSDAEVLLKNLLTADGYKFEHTAPDRKQKQELIMFDPSKASRIKQIYKKVQGLYPSKESELAELNERIQAEAEATLTKERFDHFQAIANEREQRINAEHKATLLEEREQRIDAEHKVELLDLKLKLAMNGLNID